ncbi:MAG: TonB-dependent receptor [Hyphomonadaceae bacterium]
MIRAVFAASVLVGAPALALADPASTPSEPEIVVTASPVTGDRDRFAVIVETVSRDQILEAGGASLSDALKQVPGVANTGFAAGASRPVIRGMDASRVKILENGVSSSDVSDIGPDHGVPIDPLSARSIEIVRGAATLRYGGQAIGGVVNAINNRVPAAPPRAPLSGEIAGGYADNANARDGSALLDAGWGPFAFHADGFARHTDDYDTPDGRQNNSFFHGGGYSAGASYFFGPGRASHVGLASVRYDADYGIPSDVTYIDMRQNKALANGVFRIDSGALQSINVAAGYADYLHKERDPDGTVESTFRNREWEGRVEALFGPLGPLATTALGVQSGHRDFSAGGEGGDYLFPTRTATAALFAFTEAPIGKRLNLQAAARVERVRTDGAPAAGVDTSLEFTPMSASLGALYDVSDVLKLGLTFTSAGRAPSQAELFARGPHDGPGTFETGDPALKIERANSVEAAVRWRGARTQIDASLWRAQFDGFVYGRLTGNLCDEAGDCASPPGADLKQLLFEQRDAAFWGGEIKAARTLWRGGAGALSANALADYVHAEFAHGGGPVPRIEPYRIGAGLDWESERFAAGAMLIYVGAQKHVPAGDTTTDEYVSLDAHAEWRPFAAQRRFEVAFIGHNLTDDMQRNAVALNRDLVEAPGRTARVVLRQTF